MIDISKIIHKQFRLEHNEVNILYSTNKFEIYIRLCIYTLINCNISYDTVTMIQINHIYRNNLLKLVTFGRLERMDMKNQQ